jgi:sugar phosphate isomerase/epimerase
MELRLFKTLWGHTGSLAEAIASARAHAFEGLEGQAPIAAGERRDWQRQLRDAGLDYIAEICTAGSYVPDRAASPARHLEDFRRNAGEAAEMEPRFLTVLAGCDAWPFAESVDFFAAALKIAADIGIAVSFETHRSRSMFHPWVTRDLLQALPELRLTCDFSHWCCVSERLVMETEPEILALCAARVHHIHARVGYDQGPQVPHPAAPEHASALIAHERWWAALWQAQLARGYRVSTMTPEFGPDGYLQCAPFSRQPVGDLVEINAWIGDRQRRHFCEVFPG